MNQTTATATTSAHSVDLEALRLQLKEDGKGIKENRFSNEAHERLLYTLRTNDCREIIATIVDEDDLANAFARAGGRDHVDVLEAFLNHGMKVDIKGEEGFTALMHASRNRREECVRLLLDRNASVDDQTKDGWTALMFASMNDDTKIVEMLLEKNTNPDIQCKYGSTALVCASSCGNKEIVQLLLNYGADIKLKGNDGKTALEFAKNEEIKEMLRNHVPGYVLK